MKVNCNANMAVYELFSKYKNVGSARNLQERVNGGYSVVGYAKGWEFPHMPELVRVVV